MTVDAENQLQRGRLTRLFEFLKAYVDLRYPPVRDITQQLRVLWLDERPDHPAMELFRDESAEEERGGDFATVLRVARPPTTACPAPPAPIGDWLKDGWQHLDGKLEIHPSRNTPAEKGRARIERFEDDPRREAVLERWRKAREEWITNERPARAALEWFQKIYEWWGVLEREGERVEMLVGDGLLRCPDELGEFKHPVLLQRVELEFHPEKRPPEFVFRKREEPPELYKELLTRLPEADSGQIAACDGELKEAEFSPLGGDDTAGFLERLIVGVFPVGGTYCKPGDAVSGDVPTMQRKLVLFMRQRRTGTANVFDQVLEDIAKRFEAGEAFAPALLQILGITSPPEKGEASEPRPMAFGNEDEEILLSKPANREQLEIAQQLARRDCVLVQGPPGTGKTHTIANLLGHLLAQGKRVLVTAHTPKALKVLRDKVVEALQPLCVSVLQSDRDSQEELKKSVERINERLSGDERQLEREVQRLREERHRTLADLRDARSRLLDARQDETRPVVVGGQETHPIEAAKKVKAGEERENWIPSPVRLGETLPVSPAEVAKLYQTNSRISLEDERELTHERLDPAALPTPTQFRELVTKLRALESQNLRLRDELWSDALSPKDLSAFQQMLEKASEAIEFFREAKPWQLDAVQAGRDGDAARKTWDDLVEFIKQAWQEILECDALVVAHGPSIADERPAHELLPVAEQLVAHLENGGSLGVWTKLTKGSWHALIEKVQINGRPPDTTKPDHLRAVRAALVISCRREDLAGRWQRKMAAGGAPAATELGNKPEKAAKGFVPQIQRCLEWHSQSWLPLESEFQQVGFNWSTYLESTPPQVGDDAELRRLRAAVVGELEVILRARAAALRARHLRFVLADWRGLLPSDGQSEAVVTQSLRQALRDASPDAYQAAHEELARLKALERDYAERLQMLTKLESSAPTWAAAIRNRNPEHSQPEPVGDVQAAWVWRQLHDELERRAATSLEQLQHRIEDLSRRLLEVTAELVEKQTWLGMIRTVSAEQRSALARYAKYKSRITLGGKGVRDPQFRAEAKREMATARRAVPVWIMPLKEVFEAFNPLTTRFDVVIVDEASQCDPTALFALYLGRQTVVVGDDEQVTPIAIGDKHEDVLKLIDERLSDVPGKALYYGDTSIYELADGAFGGVIRLKEHFRCAPDIIAFSNRLSYRDEIKPLREESSIRLCPHVIPYRVEGGIASPTLVNQVEAEVVASLICAAIEQPEYAVNESGKPMTFGVVNLVGDEQAQALAIDRMLRQRLLPEEYQRRQILCGNPGQFQGDERDVMLLSMVDSGQGEPLSMRSADANRKLFKKRYNVAASRARDQMWVVYSLDHENDLKPGDIRRQLIEHARDPKAWQRELEKRLAKVDPNSKVFEGAVLRRLMERQYNVLPQYHVGAYRIDLVVTGGGKMLAVECDGERWHGLDKLQEDMERQALLERLGWRFVRVRGSVFFRDPERAMAEVFRRLDELGIPPESSRDREATRQPADDLRDRVIRRAQELRQQWEEQNKQAK
jgi:very-short-patch-repair endonuclease